LVKHTKTGGNIPNWNNIFRIPFKYINIFHFKAVWNFPKLGFWVWQPWRASICKLDRCFLKKILTATSKQGKLRL
jgi:hypothetical protein